MSGTPGGRGTLGWAAMRPVFVAMLLAVDLGVVLVLGIGRHKGWLPPIIGFGIVLVGLIWFMGWAVGHRHDDDPES